MTRQEAINSITKNAPYTMFQLIHQIYNDFETRSCMNCINNSFCGVYSFLKNVKNESNEINTFNCSQYAKWSKE